ncbi:MAG: sodium:solute symporter family transporter [Blautia marasmi]
MGRAAYLCNGVCVCRVLPFAGRIQRIGQKYHILSIPDLITKRFGRLPALIASAIIGWTVIGTAGTQMVASSKILQMVMADDWEISYRAALVVTTVIVIAYTTLSGFYGVAYTDTLQGILLIVVIGVALPAAALAKVGGPAELAASLPKHYFELKFDKSIVSYMVVYLLYFWPGLHTGSVPSRLRLPRWRARGHRGKCDHPVLQFCSHHHRCLRTGAVSPLFLKGIPRDADSSTCKRILSSYLICAGDHVPDCYCYVNH